MRTHILRIITDITCYWHEFLDLVYLHKNMYMILMLSLMYPLDSLGKQVHLLVSHWMKHCRSQTVTLQNSSYQGRSDHICMYACAYLKNLKKYLFIYLFIDLLVKSDFYICYSFSHCIAAILHKENSVNIALFIHFNTGVQNPVITTTVTKSKAKIKW